LGAAAGLLWTLAPVPGETGAFCCAMRRPNEWRPPLSALGGPSDCRACQSPCLEHYAATAPAWGWAGDRLVACGSFSAREADPCGAPHTIFRSNDLVRQTETLDQLELVHVQDVELPDLQLRHTLPWRHPGAGSNAVELKGSVTTLVPSRVTTDPPVRADFDWSAFSRRSLPQIAIHSRRRSAGKLGSTHIVKPDPSKTTVGLTMIGHGWRRSS